MNIKKILNKIVVLGTIGMFVKLTTCNVYATSAINNDPLGINFNATNSSGGAVSSLQIFLLLTVIALAPAIIMTVTSFTRVIVVLHFVRSALGTQQTPPNQVLIGLALFISLFIMSPTLNSVNTNAIQPYSNGEIAFDEMVQKSTEPFQQFMLKQTGEKEIRIFMDIAGIEYVENVSEIPLEVLIPSFIISELRIAFIIGFMIYIPFIVIDMVVASTLMSMGMMMLPPVMISLPFKLLLFVVADGWQLIIGELVKSFY